MSFDPRLRALGRVEDILAAIEEIESFIAGVGEAAKNLAAGIEARRPQIPWRDVRAMRDRIVHEYGKVNPRFIWQVATTDLIPLRAAMIAERDWLASA